MPLLSHCLQIYRKDVNCWIISVAVASTCAASSEMPLKVQKVLLVCLFSHCSLPQIALLWKLSCCSRDCAQPGPVKLARMVGRNAPNIYAARRDSGGAASDGKRMNMVRHVGTPFVPVASELAARPTGREHRQNCMHQWPPLAVGESARKSLQPRCDGPV